MKVRQVNLGRGNAVVCSTAVAASASEWSAVANRPPFAHGTPRFGQGRSSTRWRSRLLFSVMLLVLFSSAAPAQTLTPGQIAGLQVGLDRLGFSPGLIDGRLGSQTQSAFEAWQLSHPTTTTNPINAVTVQQLTPADGWSRIYELATNDVTQLGRAPLDWLERSKLDRLAFESLTELLAEKFRCKEGFLQSLNPEISDWTNLQPGQQLVVPNVTTDATQPLPLAHMVVVSLSQKWIRALNADGKVIAHFPCSIAALKEKQPVGKLTVQAVAVNPNYTYDPINFPELDALQLSYGKLIVPAGPNNPVGTAWISLSLPGYGIHGSPHPDQIGKTASHGCFRLANWNADRLVRIIEIGTPVDIVE